MIRPKPIVVTPGEPAGIGYEIIQTAWKQVRSDIDLALLADPRHFSGPIDVLEKLEDASLHQGDLPVLPITFAGNYTPGTPDPKNAAATVEAIEKAVQLALINEASGICTLPIHKKALKDGADFAYPGHTEFLAALAGVDDVVMMLACPELRVVPATIHIALNDVPELLTPESLEKTIRITSKSLADQFGIEAPRIAVAGLNPHAGEGGVMGKEELEYIAPLLDELRREGMQVSGPLPADTMFHSAARAKYDVAIAMYHDQALIPIKTIDFAGGVNVTLGLPFIRTSPDHGTAFDITGKGIADPASLVAALRMAWDMASRKLDLA